MNDNSQIVRLPYLFTLHKNISFYFLSTVGLMNQTPTLSTQYGLDESSPYVKSNQDRFDESNPFKTA